MRWLMRFLVTCFAAFPDHRYGQPVASPRDGILGQLEVAGDALGSRVKQKAKKQGVWRAMDQQTRQSIALPVGDRRHDSAKQVWTALPVVYREQAPLYTDQYAVDLGVMSAAQPPSEPPARPDNQLSRAFQEYGAAACLPSRPG